MIALWTLGHEPPGPLETCRVASYNPPPLNLRGNPNKLAEQIGGPIFRQNSFRLTWIAVPGPKHTFPLVVVPSSGAGRPTLGVEDSYAAYGGHNAYGPEGGSPVCTMNCDSTQHIQNSKHPTPGHARIGTAPHGTFGSF